MCNFIKQILIESPVKEKPLWDKQFVEVSPCDSWDYVIRQTSLMVRLVLKDIGGEIGAGQERYYKEECKVEGNNILVHSKTHIDLTLSNFYNTSRELDTPYTIPIEQCTFYKETGNV